MVLVDKKPHVVLIPKGEQIIQVVDFSGSMDTNDGELTDGKSRLLYAAKQTVALASEAGKVDPDGIDLITFADDVETFWNTTPQKVAEAFQYGTRGCTNTALALQTAWNRHLEIGSSRTKVLLVTDGVPYSNGNERRSKQAVEDLLIKIGKTTQSPTTFSVNILTVGKLNRDTRRWLEELDGDEDNVGLTGIAAKSGVDLVGIEPLCGATFKALDN